MDAQAKALENLTVIRSLMERATTYRAISASAALVGGLLSLAACAAIFFKFSTSSDSVPPGEFLAIWLGVLLLATITNLFLLARAAKERGETTFNRGFRTAIIAIFPPLLVGGVLGIGAALYEAYLFSAIIWACCYGLALLATRSFAPRSIRWLGIAFLLAGLGNAIFFLLTNVNDPGSSGLDPAVQASKGLFLLGATFGLFHLVYGIAVIMRSRKQSSHQTASDVA